MLLYYKENIQLYLILFAWLLTGMFGGPLIYLIVPATLFLMMRKGMYEELLIGYFFILILSDSLNEQLSFAKDLKNIYISFLAVFFFFNINNFQPLNKLYKLFIPFFLFSAFTMFFSMHDPFFSTSVQKTVSYFLSFLVIPNIITKAYKERGLEFLKQFIYFCLTSLLLGLIMILVANDAVFIESGRYRGVMGNPNGLGIYTFLIFIIFFLVTRFFPDLFPKAERVFIFIVIFISIYLTNSRNAVLAVLIFYVFQRFYSGSPFIGFTLFAITLFTIEIISVNFTSIIVSLGLSDYFRINTLEDGSGRYIAWNFAWMHIQENFFIGKGFAYNEYYMRQHYPELSKLGHQGGIHNSFLTFWMDQGLIGLLIYLRSFILVFIKAAHNTKFAYPIMFAIAFTAIFESWLVGSLSAYAFLAMFVYTLATSEEMQSESIPELNKLAIN